MVHELSNTYDSFLLRPRTKTRYQYQESVENQPVDCLYNLWPANDGELIQFKTVGVAENFVLMDNSRRSNQE